MSSIRHEWVIRGLAPDVGSVSSEGDTPCRVIEFLWIGGTMKEALSAFEHRWPGVAVQTLTRFAMCPTCPARVDTPAGMCSNCYAARGGS